MEIEAKYRVADPAALVRVAALKRLGPYELQAAAAPEQQENSYFDTPDRALERARYGLRVRRVAGRAVVTLKGPNEVRDGVHRRAEWEFPGDDPDPRSWPLGEARTVTEALLGGQPLAQTLTIRTTRQVVAVLREGDDVAELALDQGTILAGGREAPICELEIELRPAGSPADLDALAEALRAHIELVAEDRSKLERGLALLQR